MNFRNAFGDFDDRVWLNCAHQGPLPLAAAAAAERAIEWKVSPARLSSERFADVPLRLRELLGQLIDVPAEEIILCNGASYGLHLLANGLPLEAGDEVLLMAGDFPSDILPWLALRERGVAVTLETPADKVLTPAEVSAALKPSTRALCMTWVHSFSGYVADLDAIGALCRERGVLFLVNTSQGLGARSFSVPRTPVDAIVNAGWKWLCGPYATGFCWMRPELRASLTYNQAYWLTQFTADDLGRDDLALGPVPRDHPRRFDLFAPANFFNFVPWAESIALLLESGLPSVEAHDQALVERLLAGLEGGPWRATSPTERSKRSTLVLVSHDDPARNPPAKDRLAEAGVDIALRRGRLRFSPHFYNTETDVDRALEALTG